MTRLTWKAEDVVRAVHGKGLHEQTWNAHGVAIDSRSAQPGDLFVALKGPLQDGHDYVDKALEAGAVAALVSQSPARVGPQAPLLFVEDTLKALEGLGRAGRARSESSVVAVTGSVGKTGTKEMLRLMLGACGETYANEGSFNNHWGVPLSLARLPQECRYSVFEMGMNHAGELGPLAKMVTPHIALITTIEAVHLEFFSGVEAIAAAKAEIFFGMDTKGAAVLNADNLQFAQLETAARARGITQILGFGRNVKVGGRLLSSAPVSGGSAIEAEIMGKPIAYFLSAPGYHLALNSLGALTAAHAAGGDIDACAKALAHFKQPKGRGVVQTIVTEKGSFTLIDESYNASPAAVHFAVRVLGDTAPGEGGRRILVLGDMLELGAASSGLHAGLRDNIIDSKVTRVFCCGEMTAHLFRVLPPELKGALEKDSAALAPHVVAFVRPGDVVTVKGSKSMHMEVILDALKALDQTSPQHQLAS